MHKPEDTKQQERLWCLQSTLSHWNEQINISTIQMGETKLCTECWWRNLLWTHRNWV